MSNTHTKPNTSCESCMMPFRKDTGIREDERYCSFCFKNGALCYQGNDVKEFQERSKQAMLEKGMHPFKVWFFTKMIASAPRWRK